MKKGQGFYLFIAILGLASGCLVIYGLIKSPADPYRLTFVGFLIAYGSLILSALGSMKDIDDKEKNKDELKQIKDSINTLTSTLESISSKVDNDEINNELKNILHKINEKDNPKNNYSLISINSCECKKDPKCK